MDVHRARTMTIAVSQYNMLKWTKINTGSLGSRVVPYAHQFPSGLNACGGEVWCMYIHGVYLNGSYDN